MHSIFLAGRLLLLLATGAVASDGRTSATVQKTTTVLPGPPREFDVAFQYKGYKQAGSRTTIFDDYLKDDVTYGNAEINVPFEGLEIVTEGKDMVLVLTLLGRVVQFQQPSREFKTTLAEALATFNERKEHAKALQRQSRIKKAKKKLVAEKRVQQQESKRTPPVVEERQKAPEVHTSCGLGDRAKVTKTTFVAVGLPEEEDQAEAAKRRVMELSATTQMMSPTPKDHPATLEQANIDPEPQLLTPPNSRNPHKKQQKTMHVQFETPTALETESNDDPNPPPTNPHYAARERQRAILSDLSTGSQTNPDDLEIFRSDGAVPSSKEQFSINILEEPEEGSDLFISNSLKSFTGVPSKRNRIAVLSDALKGKLQSRGPHDLYIFTRTTERELVAGALEKGQGVLCQASVSDYKRLFTYLGSGSLTDTFTALPIASLYQDAYLGKNLPLFEEDYFNEDGTGLLAKRLVASPEILSRLESDGEILVFGDAAIFQPPKEKHSPKYTLPNADALNKASFVITQKLDMSGLSLFEWRLRKGDLGKYIAMYYEAVYVTAIAQKARVVLLTSVLSKATPEQYAYMLDVLLRVHRLRSPRLDATQIILAMPPECEGLDYEEAVRQQYSEFAKWESRIYLGRDISADDVRVLEQTPPSEHISEDGELGESEAEEPDAGGAPIVMELELKNMEVDVYLDDFDSSLLLSNYFKSPKEAQRRARLTPATFAVGKSHYSNANVIINTLHVDGSRQ